MEGERLGIGGEKEMERRVFPPTPSHKLPYDNQKTIKRFKVVSISSCARQELVIKKNDRDDVRRVAKARNPRSTQKADTVNDRKIRRIHTR